MNEYVLTGFEYGLFKEAQLPEINAFLQSIRAASPFVSTAGRAAKSKANALTVRMMETPELRPLLEKPYSFMTNPQTMQGVSEAFARVSPGSIGSEFLLPSLMASPKVIGQVSKAGKNVMDVWRHGVQTKGPRWSGLADTEALAKEISRLGPG